MDTKINFSEVPSGYAMCLHAQCPKAKECLRQLVVRSVPQEHEYWRIVNPNLAGMVEGECPYFRSSTKVRYAYGFMNMLDSLPYNKRKGVITRLIGYFGQRTYYRSRKGERPLPPEEQQAVKNIIRQFGISDIGEFDLYKDGYVWKEW